MIADDAVLFREGLARVLEAAQQIRAEQPQVGVLVLSQYVEPHHAIQLLQGGASGVGYLLKDRVADVNEVIDAGRRVSACGSVIDPEVVAQLVSRRRTRDPIQELTERERQVLALMAEGRSNQAICQRLFLSPKTVEGHVRSIFTRLDLAATPTTTAASSPCSPSCGHSTGSSRSRTSVGT
jgi:DNA-binding NarL/FixJ family response regulator